MGLPAERKEEHARARPLEALVFRAACRSAPLYETLVHGYVSLRMGAASEARRGAGMGHLIRASAERFGELAAGREKWTYTRRHCGEVGFLSYVMAREALLHGVPGSEGLDPEMCLAGGFIHDVGKTFLPLALVAKEMGVAFGPFSFFGGSPLTEVERRALHLHHLSAGTTFLRLFVDGWKLRPLLDMVGLHHVSYNGMDTTHPSYPKLMKGCELPLHCRIAKAADFLSAVLPRAYRAGEDQWVFSFYDALAYALTVSGRELDSAAVACFLAGTHDMGYGEAARLAERLAHPGGQEAISDAGRIRSHVARAVMVDEGFAGAMARRSEAKLDMYRAEARECAAGFGIPLHEELTA